MEQIRHAAGGSSLGIALVGQYHSDAKPPENFARAYIPGLEKADEIGIEFQSSRKFARLHFLVYQRTDKTGFIGKSIHFHFRVCVSNRHNCDDSAYFAHCHLFLLLLLFFMLLETCSPDCTNWRN